MNMNKYLLVLLFVCVMLICYNVFINIFTFNFIKVIDIEIKKSIQNNKLVNSTQNSFLIPIFIATLENTKKCKIDVLNRIMIEKIIDDIELKQIQYYIIIKDDDNKICSKPINNLEIFVCYLSFYFIIIFFSIITMAILDSFDLFVVYNRIKKTNIIKSNEFNNFVSV